MDNSREYPVHPICGVGLIVRRDDSVLLIRRGNPPRRGEWGLPGGGVELGETLSEAAAREVREECGIEIAIGDVIDAVDIMARDDAGRLRFHYIVVDLAARYVSGDLCAASDVLDARWIALTDLDTLALPAMTRAVIDKCVGNVARAASPQRQPSRRRAPRSK